MIHGQSFEKSELSRYGFVLYNAFFCRDFHTLKRIIKLLNIPFVSLSDQVF